MNMQGCGALRTPYLHISLGLLIPAAVGGNRKDPHSQATEALPATTPVAIWRLVFSLMLLWHLTLLTIPSFQTLLPQSLVHSLGSLPLFLETFMYVCMYVCMCLFYRETERKGEKKRNIYVREKHRSVATHTRPNQGLNLQPKHDQGSNWRPFTLWDDAQPTEPHRSVLHQ